MRRLGIVLLLGLFCTISTASAEKLIAENPLIAVRVKSYNTFIGLVPQMLQMQVAEVEEEFPFLDKRKEAVVVMTSIMPPVAYAAIPVAKGFQMDAINKSLPVDMQAKAQLRDDYLFLPFAGELPQTIGKGKLPENTSTVQLNFDIETINKLNGPMIAVLMQQDFSQMLPSNNEQEAKIMKATIDFYKFLLMDLLKSAKNIDLKIDKTEAYKIDINGEFIAGSNWAAVCKSHSNLTIPTSSVIKEGPMYFSAAVDYSSMKPFMDPLNKYMETLGETMGTSGMGDIMDSFSKLGMTKTIGSFGMSDTDMKMDYIFKGPENSDMTAIMKSMTSYMSADNEILKMEKLAEKVNGQDIYKYSMKAVDENMINIEAFMMAQKNGFYYASKKEDLAKYSQAKIEDGTKKGFMWMKMDMSSLSENNDLPVPVALPVIEVLSTASETGMRSVITIK